MYQTANEFDGVKTGTHMGLGNAQRVELESADLPVLHHIISRILCIGHDVGTNPKVRTRGTVKATTAYAPHGR